VYYNIKIKSNGSEFILESQNKEVTQREMDLYFAGIFDVSNEFKANIKQIEIVNQNVKSIQELEASNTTKEKIEFSSNIPKQTYQEQVPTVKFQNDTLSIQETKNINKLEFVQNTSNEEAPQENIVQQPQITQEQDAKKIEAQPEITYTQIEQNTKSTEAQQEVLQAPDAENVEPQEEISQTQDILTEQKVKEVIDDNINDYFQTNAQEEYTFTNNMQADIIIPEGDNDLIKYNKTKNEIDELINLAQEKLDTADTTIDVSAILASGNKNEEETTFSRGFKQSIESTQQASKPAEEIKTDYNQTKLDDIFNISTEKETPKQPTTQNIPALDFKPFLSGYACKSLQDEFIVCAYFIKHALKQPSFTIKFINSKLFQATSKIADMSIIDEMVMKEYIKVIDYETPKTYCITAQGEIYFTSLQG